MAATLSKADTGVASGSRSVSIPNAHLRHGAGPGSDDVSPPGTISSTAGAVTGVDPGLGVDRHHTYGGHSPSFKLIVEATGSITPALLAKHHLPGILLQHGPLAIRHITAHLIQNLPGFSSVPPARQRRLVVGALEGRGGITGAHGEVGGLSGDVIFEKVGWGRWDARRKGDPPRDRPAAHTALQDHLPPPGAYNSRSYPGESGIFVQSEEEEGSHDDDDTNMEDADKMDDTSSTETDDDMTDEEDWAQMGPEALRRQGGSPISSAGWTNSFGKSPGTFWNKSHPENEMEKRAREEREAVEALVKLSSV